MNKKWFTRKERCIMIEQEITKLVKYGVEKGLLKQEDYIYTINRLLELFYLEEYQKQENCDNTSLEEILNNMLDYAVKKNIIEDSIVYRDLFDTKIMGLLTPCPSQVIERFWTLYKQSPQKATKWYYEFSQDTNYIRRYRISKDKKWVTKTPKIPRTLITK